MNEAQDMERRSSAVTLSDMEVFIFPELIYSLVLANIMSPRLWRWRSDPWFDGLARMKPYRRITRLKQFIMDSVYKVSLKLNQAYWAQHKLQSLDVNITGMWFQISNNYAFHETHVHGNCSWSGVYYVQSGNASRSRDDILDNGMLNGVTRFYGPDMDYSAGGHGDWGNYYLHHSNHTSYPEDGRLLVFPSHIRHTAFPYSGEQDRIIVSFHAQVVSDTEVQYDYSYD